MFERIAAALELKGETGFRVLAYRDAARALLDLTEDLGRLDERGELGTIPGIGEGILQKIREFLSTGRIQKHDEALEGLPPGLFDMLNIPGVGPKTARLLHERLGISTLDDLRRTLEDGSAAALPGMGARKVENIRRGIAAASPAENRMYLDEALELAEEVAGRLAAASTVTQVTYAGSLRRGGESIRDVDLLAAAGDGPAVVAAFTGHPRVRQVLAAGTTKASARFETGDGLRQVDLRVIDDASWGAALQYFTGSKAHNVALRALARRKGLKLSERGVLRRGRRIAGRTEQEVYAALGLPWIDPELREDRGELAAAATGSLPGLVTLDDIRADLHMHTDRSDGTASFEEMARACAARGYSHIAVAEHSVSAGYADGLDIEALQRLCDHIDAFNGNAHSRRFRVLKSSEVDIRPDGSLDYPDRVLARLDLVIASIHQAFQRDATRRMCGAIEHPLVHLVAHPTGRIIGRRPGYDIDLDRVIDCAARHHKVLEINAYPGRLDLSDLWARKATQAGVKLAVNTDAHSAADLGWMRFGVTTARRAWAKPGDIVNCLTYRQLLKLLSEIRGN